MLTGRFLCLAIRGVTALNPVRTCVHMASVNMIEMIVNNDLCVHIILQCAYTSLSILHKIWLLDQIYPNCFRIIHSNQYRIQFCVGIEFSKEVIPWSNHRWFLVSIWQWYLSKIILDRLVSSIIRGAWGGSAIFFLNSHNFLHNRSGILNKAPLRRIFAWLWYSW